MSTLEETPAGGEGVKIVLGRGNCRCQGPEAWARGGGRERSMERK